jgi:hypothetical protein
VQLYRQQETQRICTWCREATEVVCTICSAPVCAQHRIDSHWCTNCVAEYHENKRLWIPESVAIFWFMMRKRGTGGDHLG